jgi:hypothetical protein
MTSKTTFADVNSTKLVNKINDLTIGEDSTDLLVVNSNVNATNGLDVTGEALTTNQAITQTGSGLVTFSGKVGIGITNPSTNLHVDGNVVVSDGNVGIGTGGPGTRLSIYGEDDESVASRLIATFTDKISQNEWTGIGLGGYYQTCKSGIIHERTAGYGIGSLHLCTNNTQDATNINKNDTRLTITATGNVGIGTTNPSTNLHVESTGSEGKIVISNETLALLQLVQPTSNKTYNIELGRTDGDLTFRSTSGEKLRITEGGNVGIGTNNPSQKLEVNGNLKVNGNVESNNNGIVQVKSSSFLGTLSGSSGSWITGLNVSITPSSSTNKIFLNLDLHWSGAQDAYFQGFIYRFVGGGSQQLVVRHNGAGSATRSSFGNRNTSHSGNQYQLENLGFSYLDSPNTTSNISYRVYVRNRGFGHGAFYINYTSSTNDSNRLTGVSTFTAFEVVP